MSIPAPRSCRPRDHLAAVVKDYPRAWREIDRFRAERGTGGLPDWPQWCFAPLGAVYAVVSHELGVQRLAVPYIADVARLGALAAWRVTQGIYRFDPALYPAVVATPIDREIPCDPLYRMPEWCVYIGTPELQWAGQPLHGAWAHLEFDVNTGRHELRLLLDGEAALDAVVVHLGAWSLDEAIERSLKESRRHAFDAGLSSMFGAAPAQAVTAELRPVGEPLLSLLLYICTQGSEVGQGEQRPAMSVPKRTKAGWRLFPADKPTTWDVGVRLGAALRRAHAAAETAGDGTHAGPRPHVRRAHWHGFRSGPIKREDGSEIPTEQRKFDLRWLPPIPVNLESADELPAVVRAVK